MRARYPWSVLCDFIVLSIYYTSYCHVICNILFWQTVFDKSMNYSLSSIELYQPIPAAKLKHYFWCKLGINMLILRMGSNLRKFQQALWDGVYQVYRDHVLYAPSQRETISQCNVPHWLGAYTKWSLGIETENKLPFSQAPSWNDVAYRTVVTKAGHRSHL